jgi:hypothetical protein
MALISSQSLEFEVSSQDDVAIYDKYARYVESCRRHERTDIIANTAYINAQFIIEQLLLLAFEKHIDVRLLTGKLDKNTYNSLAPAFLKVLNGDNRVKILILSSEADSLIENQVYTLVSDHKRELSP